MRAAYQTGRLTNGGGGLKDVPIIDYRAYADDSASGDIHLRYHSFSMRERLRKANGDADNQVMLVEDNRYGLYSSASPMLLDALKQMDLWLAAIAADTGGGSKHEKVVRNKPATLQEGCLTRDASADEDRREAGPHERPVRGALPGAGLAARRRRRLDRRRRHQVPAQGGRRQSDYTPAVQRGAAGAAGGDLPAGRVRLEPAGRRAAGPARHLAVVLIR